MGNKIEDLREHLFATLSDLRNTEKPMDIERAKAVAEVARAVIDSAKVEVEHMKVSGSPGSGFISELPTPAPGAPRLVRGRDTRG